MVARTYQQELAGSFIDDPQWNYAMKFVCTVYVQMENYDRTLPHTIGPDGDAKVVHWMEDRSRSNARVMQRAILRRLHYLEPAQRKKVQDHVRKLTSKQQAEICGIELQPLEPI